MYLYMNLGIIEHVYTMETPAVTSRRIVPSPPPPRAGDGDGMFMLAERCARREQTGETVFLSRSVFGLYPIFAARCFLFASFSSKKNDRPPPLCITGRTSCFLCCLSRETFSSVSSRRLSSYFGVHTLRLITRCFLHAKFGAGV